MMTSLRHNFVTEQRVVITSYIFIKEEMSPFLYTVGFLVVSYRGRLQIKFQHLVATNGRLSCH